MQLSCHSWLKCFHSYPFGTVLLCTFVLFVALPAGTAQEDRAKIIRDSLQMIHQAGQRVLSDSTLSRDQKNEQYGPLIKKAFSLKRELRKLENERDLPEKLARAKKETALKKRLNRKKVNLWQAQIAQMDALIQVYQDSLKQVALCTICPGQDRILAIRALGKLDEPDNLLFLFQHMPDLYISEYALNGGYSNSETEWISWRVPGELDIHEPRDQWVLLRPILAALEKEYTGDIPVIILRYALRRNVLSSFTDEAYLQFLKLLKENSQNGQQQQNLQFIIDWGGEW